MNRKLDVLRLSPDTVTDEEAAVHQVVEHVANVLLKQSAVAAVPTDTVYGLCACMGHQEAVDRIYALKSRVSHKPLALCLHSWDAVRVWTHSRHLTDSLLRALLPGPVTLVLSRDHTRLPAFLNPTHTCVGVRVPASSFMRQLVARVEQPLVLTSANVSGDESCLCVSEFETLAAQVDCVVEGSAGAPISGSRLGSSVVNLCVPGYFSFVRQGCAYKITRQTLIDHGLRERSD